MDPGIFKRVALDEDSFPATPDFSKKESTQMNLEGDSNLQVLARPLKKSAFRGMAANAYGATKGVKEHLRPKKLGRVFLESLEEVNGPPEKKKAEKTIDEKGGNELQGKEEARVMEERSAHEEQGEQRKKEVRFKLGKK